VASIGVRDRGDDELEASPVEAGKVAAEVDRLSAEQRGGDSK
jgi:hypothetical protein